MKIKIIEQWKNIETVKLMQNYEPTTYIFEDSNLNVRADKVWKWMTGKAFSRKIIINLGAESVEQCRAPA
jgi:hypothetical protein